MIRPAPCFRQPSGYARVPTGTCWGPERNDHERTMAVRAGTQQRHERSQWYAEGAVTANLYPDPCRHTELRRPDEAQCSPDAHRSTQLRGSEVPESVHTPHEVRAAGSVGLGGTLRAPTYPLKPQGNASTPFLDALHHPVTDPSLQAGIPIGQRLPLQY